MVDRWPVRAELPDGIDSGAVWEVFERAAAAAARHTLSHFRTPITIENKSAHGFDPVTEADRAAERAIREVIAAAFPDHAIVGEELEDTPGTGAYAWLIDPIDGTRGFIAGLPLWGTLIGLSHAGHAVAGHMSQPFLGETYTALAGAARAERAGVAVPLSTSGVRTLATARLATTSPTMFESHASRAAYAAVEAACRLARYGTDCYGYCMLAAGHVDLVIEEGLRPLDIVALIPIVEAAGGVITDWRGRPADDGGQILAAASADLHAEALALLQVASG